MKTTTLKKKPSNILVIPAPKITNILPISVQVMLAKRKQWDKSKSRAKARWKNDV